PTVRKQFLRGIQDSRLRRAGLIAQLERLGWHITYIPSTSDDELSLNYLNGIQLKDRFIMPAYGGIFAELDSAARAAFEKAIPGLRIDLIYCGESQRRNGALHCSASIL